MLSLLLGEPFVARAIALEDAATTGPAGTEVFSPGTQLIGLAAVSILIGVSIRGVFGAV